MAKVFESSYISKNQVGNKKQKRNKPKTCSMSIIGKS